MEQDEESTHVTEMASTTISAAKTSSNNLGSGRFHHEKYQEDAGVGESDHEGISNMGNQSLDVNEDIYNEASKGNLEVEITGLDGCAYPFPNKFSKDDHATVDNESGGSHVYSRNASGEGRGTNVVELSVGEGMPPGVSIMDKTGNASGEVEGTNVDEPSFEGITPAILEERVIAETRDFEEADKLLEFNAETHATPGSTAGDMEKEIYFAEITQCSGGSGFDLPLSHVYALEHQGLEQANAFHFLVFILFFILLSGNPFSSCFFLSTFSCNIHIFILSLWQRPQRNVFEHTESSRPKTRFVPFSSVFSGLNDQTKV